MSERGLLAGWVEDEATALEEALRVRTSLPRDARRRARAALMAAWMATEASETRAMVAALRRLMHERRRLPGPAASSLTEMRLLRPVSPGVRLPTPDRDRRRLLAGHALRWRPLQAVTERRLRWFEERAARHAPTLVKPVAAPDNSGGAHLAGELELIRKRGRRPRR